MKKILVFLTATLCLTFAACTPIQIEQVEKNALSDNEQYRLAVHITDHDSAVIHLTDTLLKDEYEVNRSGSPEMQDEYGWYVQIGIYRAMLHYVKDSLEGEAKKIGVKDMQLELYKCEYNQKGELFHMVELPSESISLKLEGNNLVFSIEIPNEYYFDLRSQADIIELQTMDCTRELPYQALTVNAGDVVTKDS
ncbi:hypothetical protein [Desulfitobacterium hafniense]|uniref:Prokaryotic membrane lipoprotein lipid attachment site profile n=2 Tax=Desulfitobacterium hafniense TaxID=49338 RepID=Q252I6_DESHY|nr:hypothetical protein [Desulfitobacterium hafniense]KTE93408.1 hypothetical protein AT727_00140 [Desulfitobacterium hafniense]BAE81806.1 hypothetical protein DSY0017 [Desulfitobacterium hafniense Y51]CDW99980.1 Prokaryotic membrane lipoprotein lipid attachment site profile [Desulfitobacterium hafniense]